jgi:hypothetical protein
LPRWAAFSFPENIPDLEKYLIRHIVPFHAVAAHAAHHAIVYDISACVVFAVKVVFLAASSIAVLRPRNRPSAIVAIGHANERQKFLEAHALSRNRLLGLVALYEAFQQLLVQVLKWAGAIVASVPATEAEMATNREIILNRLPAIYAIWLWFPSHKSMLASTSTVFTLWVHAPIAGTLICVLCAAQMSIPAVVFIFHLLILTAKPAFLRIFPLKSSLSLWM